MRFFDTHIHLTDIDVSCPSELIQRFVGQGIEKCVCVSARPKDWEKTAKLASDFKNYIIPAFGLHPWYIDEAPVDFQSRLEGYIRAFPSAAVGECGFDRLKNPNLNYQKKVFDIQMDIALKYNRALIVHAVKADEMVQGYDSLLPQKTIFHSYSGSCERLKKIIKNNMYISVNKRFFNKKDAKCIVEKVPYEKLLIETDAPYQSDVEDLSCVVERIAEIWGKDKNDIADTLYANAERVFMYD